MPPSSSERQSVEVKLPILIGVNIIALAALASSAAKGAPPFSGTIFIDPDIITSSDPTTFQSASYAGRGLRTMFDRRVNNWINVNAYLVAATFSDGLAAEIQVNPEFGSPAAALTEAQKYGAVIGRLPTALRADVQTVWIHQGTQPFGGGNHNLLIHTGQSALYEADGILEETLVHESSHTSLDAAHAATAGWLAAQAADGEFISTYARDNRTREDIAESFLPYLAVRHRSERISQSLADTILQTIPNRIAYFDDQSFNMFPLVVPTAGDFNTDGTVDAADLAQWQGDFGLNGDSDADNDGDSDGADFLSWQRQLGSGSPTTASSAAVPEPATLATLLLGMLLLTVRRDSAASSCGAH
jgi:hypothetical protein